MIASLNFSLATPMQNIELIQVLRDNIDGADGLDNPRFISITSDHSKVFVASGDDDSLAIYNLDSDFKLTFSQIFKNSASDINGLKGASSITLLDNDKKVIVAGFYDGALTLFSSDKNLYKFSKEISDGLDYKRVFDRSISVGKLDTLGLLGAWEVISSTDNNQLLVASYMSNAIAIFDVMPDENIALNNIVIQNGVLNAGLGRPVSLALSPMNDELYVLGFEGHQLTIFDRDESGTLLAKQILTNGIDGVEHMLNPQKVVVSPNGKFLYVAASGSNAIVVLKKDKNGKFVFLQAFSDIDTDGNGLNGVSSLAISSDGSTIYAAGESGTGLFILNVNDNGLLQLESKLLRDVNTNYELKGISSITLTNDDRHLLLTKAKSDSLLVFKVIVYQVK